MQEMPPEELLMSPPPFPIPETLNADGEENVAVTLWA
jgi:hypothetical protein